jgi:hypothetical protein
MNAPKEPISKPVAKRKHKQLPVVRLRIHALGHENGYKSVMDIWKKLNSMGYEISHSQLTRIANNTADMLDKRLLAALAVIFNCSVRDLFYED